MPKPSKCKICKTPFEKRNLSHSVCSYDCSIIWNKQEQERKWQKRKKEMISTIETKSQLENKLQPRINEIARLIDNSYNCMMCGKPMKRINGCHYHSIGSNSSLRFNLLNIFAGCHSCNGEKGGNINGYDIQLIDTFGKPFWEWLKFDLVRENPILKLSKPELEEIYSKALEIIKFLKRKDAVYTNEERIALRKDLNKVLGIYKELD